MTRVHRNRSQPVSQSCGTYKKSTNVCSTWGSHLGPVSISQVNDCDDWSGIPFVDSNLTVDHHRYDPPRVTGTGPCTGLYINHGKWENNIPSLWGASYYAGYTSARDALSNYEASGSDAAEVAAKTNPSRPVVDLPVFLYELREIPELLRWTGERLLSRRVSGAYLAFNFGAAPLVSDLLKLLDFHAQTEQRIQELNRLFNGGLRRRVNLSTLGFADGQHGPVLISYNAGNLSINGSIAWSSNVTRWATVDWAPDAGALPATDQRLLLTLRSILGLTVDMSTLWEIMPWSWLIDWCTSIGSYLDANRNIVGAHCVDMCIMTHSKVEVSYTVTSKPSYLNVSNGSGKTVFEKKKRRVGLTPSVEAKLPFLSGRQFGILAALAIMKTPRSAIRF